MKWFHKHDWDYRIDVNSDSFSYGQDRKGMEATAWRICTKKGCNAHKFYWYKKNTRFVRNPTSAEMTQQLKDDGYVEKTVTVLEKP